MQESGDACTRLSCNSHFQEETAVEPVDALSTLTIRGVTIRNRIGMSPMCQYSAENGYPNDWHLVHLGSRASGGAGLVMVEATAVQPEGRITPGDTGLWDDDHIESFARIARYIASQGATPAIQLAHAGRKASCRVPWEGGAPLAANEGGWQTIAPSAIPFNQGQPVPRAATLDDIETIKRLFAAATARAVQAGFQVIELHGAHGYLLHEFLSPLSNQRTDQYGGSLENRMRLMLEVVERMRTAMPDSLPLFARLSCTDWIDGGWDLGQSIALAKELKARGVDLIDCSSGAIVPVAKIPVGKGYQVPFAAAIKRDAAIRTAAVGMITEPLHVNEIVVEGQADLVLIGRELLREPYFAHHVSTALNEEPAWPQPYGYAVRRRQSHATAQPKDVARK
jgi:2,4-dienoyl-CoA reductase-like NADH-dependent reductase (Old Yellow Enzyme family)